MGRYGPGAAIPVVRLSGALGLSLLVLSCGGDGTGVDTVASVSVTPEAPMIDIGDTRQLEATVRNDRGDVITTSVTWTSSDTTVAGVTGTGLVTAVAPGTAIVTASAGGQIDFATVTVNEPPPPAAPSGVQAEPTSTTTLDVTWTDHSDDEDEFRIQRQTVSGAAAGAGSAAQDFTEVGVVDANVTAFEDTGLEPGTEYRYRVLACHEYGCSDPSGASDPVATLAVLVVETAALPDGVLDQPYEATLVAAGGDGDLTWEVSAGQLPPPLELDGATGVVSGTPETTGRFDVTVQVASGDGQVAESDLSITVHEVLEITTAQLPDGKVGVAYSQTLASTGGDGSTTWSIVSGSLPDGLEIDPASGEIGGIPGASGTFDFTVRASGGDGQTDERALSITVDAAEGVTITTTSLPDAERGTPYSETLTASGGDGTFTWARTGGDELPDGLTLDGSSGEISGTPTATGTSDFTVEVSSAGQTDERALSITVNLAPVSIDSDYLVTAYPGAPYSDVVEASGGDGSFTWSVTGGSLPDGLALSSSTGEISGTAGAPGAYYFTVTVGSAGSLASKTYAVATSTKAAGAFNMGIMNVAGNTIPPASIVTELTHALARWEEAVTGDLEDVTYPEGFWESRAPTLCGGDAPKLDGQFVDDMVVLVALDSIDGPGNTIGRAGPCALRLVTEPPDLNTAFGRLTLDTSDLDGLDTHQLFSLFFHEIGHIVGLGTLWRAGTVFSSGSDLISDAIADGGTDPRYEGPGGNGVFTGALGGGSEGAERIPVEDDGGSGTRDAHWEESEFDHEILTGFIEPAGTTMSISSMTIAAVGDFAYTVDTGAADSYSIPACAPACSTPPPALAAAPGASDAPLDDILDEPMWAVRPDGTVVRVGPRRRP